nr:hypothetical protein [Halosolutus gelatinilyticus]
MTPKAVLASTAIPTLFEAVEISEERSSSSDRTSSDDDSDYYWDGLFSQNPRSGTS